MERNANLFVPDQRRDEILCRAASQRAHAVLTRSGLGGWKTYRTRFVSADPVRGTFCLELPLDEDKAERLILPAGEQIGVSFRRGRTKCVFTSMVIETQEPAGGPSPGLMQVRWPVHLQEMQRRVFGRVSPPAGQRIEVAIEPPPGAWAMSHAAVLPSLGHDAPGATHGEGRQEAPPIVRLSAAVSGRMEDLSAGGLSVVLDDAHGLQVNDAIVCSFRIGASGEPLRFDARLRHVQPRARGRVMLGFQFLGLEHTTEGQCRLAQLATIASGFRRARIQRVKGRLPTGPRSR